MLTPCRFNSSMSLTSFPLNRLGTSSASRVGPGFGLCQGWGILLRRYGDFTTGRDTCIRLRPERRNHVWSYDFVEGRTHDGRSLRLLTLIDEFTRQCLAIRVARRLNSAHVIELLGDCMLEHGVPEHVRSDNGAEMTARRVRSWLETVGTEPLFIEPGSPWENGYCESFNGKLRDECLNGEIFYSLKEARVVIEMWRKYYNTVRPHSALGYRPPAPAGWIVAA
jgi:putative transposase